MEINSPWTVSSYYLLSIYISVTFDEIKTKNEFISVIHFPSKGVTFDEIKTKNEFISVIHFP